MACESSSVFVKTDRYSEIGERQGTLEDVRDATRGDATRDARAMMMIDRDVYGVKDATEGVV